ncbi:beta-glucan synthesis-associated [Auriculariales sp. MPI-PUGE-AT-0066]|nr:beta-glucan synthesis-associated [Auriculariales sp. MPI-PUGE-AT-0066]
MSAQQPGQRPTLEGNDVGSSSVVRPQSLQYRSSTVSPLVPPKDNRFSRMSTYSDSKYPLSSSAASWGPNTAGAFLLAHGPYDPALDNHGRDDDDRFHDPDPPGYRDKLSAANARGMCNVIVIIIILLGMFALFIGYPVTQFVINDSVRTLISNNQQVNATGQAPILATLPKMIDPDTPDDVRTRTGLFSGDEYELVFSDEFNQDYRTFAPGDDPFWEAVDIWYGATRDLEWYDPDAVTTQDGYLRIKLEIVPDVTSNHEMRYKSGMLQSWNKLCFTEGYIEAKIQLPGKPTSSGYWPGFWIMGNLGRPGYGATTDGTWPYSYDTCDIGTLPNQTNAQNGPPATKNLPDPYGRDSTNRDLSWLPGQKLSACTCPGEDHPGPMVNGKFRGRGAPEIDVFEAQRCKRRGDNARGCVSQSAQFAPFTSLYNHVYDEPAFTIHTPERTEANYFRGSATQQSVSCIVNVSDTTYHESDGMGSAFGDFGVFGFEWQANEDPTQAYVAWVADGARSHTITAATVGPDAETAIGQRLIPSEPMSIILNLGVSDGFQSVLEETMTFPAEFLIDYVRVYQKKGAGDAAMSCDPPDYPTSQYINDHIRAYTNANDSFWKTSGFDFPRNEQLVGTC